MSSKRKNADILALAMLVAIGCTTEVDEPMADPTIIDAQRCLMPDCGCGEIDRQGAIGPVPPDELGHWAAGRIEVGAEPFEVTEVVYGLVGPEGGDRTAACDPNVPIEVQLFVSDSDTPPAEPVVLWSEPSAPADSDDVNFLRVTVETPVRVEPTQRLFVAVQMAGTAEGYACLYSCEEVSQAESDRSWWSNAVEPEYAWASLSDFGLTYAYNVGVNGRVAQ